MYRDFLLILFLLSVNLVYSKDCPNCSLEHSNVNAISFNTYLSSDTSLTESKPKETIRPHRKPIFSLGAGVLKFYGDVEDAYSQNLIMGNRAINLGISHRLNNYLSARFSVVFGNLTGNANFQNSNFNFKTQILNGSVMLSYNFYHWLHKSESNFTYRKQRRLIPMISLGVGAFNFASKGDFYDANGYKYHYWSDGTIRNLPESHDNELNSLVLHRDYEYETDLRKLDADGLGKYYKSALTIPIDLSVEYNLHKRVIFKFGSTFYWVINDNIDNISKGTGVRKGGKGGDSYVYTYVSVKVDLFKDDLKKENSFLKDIPYVPSGVIASILKEDEDKDGVPDIWDKCLETPEGISVDSKGCALDNDNDGFANYLDKELNTEKDSITNLKGVKLTPQEWQAYSDTSMSVSYEDICQYYPNICYENAGERYRNLSAQIPEKFLYLDKNKDEYLSLEEISKAIDDFFNMKTELTIEDIYELTAFFFNQ